MVQPVGGGRANEAPCQVGIATSVSLVLAEEPEATSKLEQMIRPWVRDCEPAPRASTRAVSGKFFGAKTLTTRVESGVTVPAIWPQIGDGNASAGQRRAACRAASLEISRPRPIIGRASVGSYSPEVMASTRAGIEGTPRSERAFGHWPTWLARQSP